MNHSYRISPWILSTVVASYLLLATVAAAQVQPSKPATPPVKPAVQAQPATTATPTEKDLVATQSELIKLLRLSPKLTTVIEHDPSLLANQEYVNANNPQLGQFLASHPEIARNPEFYLFTHMNGSDVTPDEALDRAVWPEMHQPYHEDTAMQSLAHDFMPLLGFVCFLGALVWLIRALFENRRWSRIFKLQSEVHGKLIDKFSSSQELAAYMETEAGKRFLEAAPIPVGFEPEQRVPNAVARVLTPLQIGIVLTLLGLGCYLLRHVGTDMKTPMLVFGTLALMPGLGFIISAGITWVLAGRLGLMPQSSKALSNDRDRQ
jgi:flagellar biogenesis protein FliO